MNGEGLRRALCIAAATALVTLAPLQARAQADLFEGRPGLTVPQQAPAEITTCDALEATLAGFEPPEDRVDLWVSGPLTFIYTDGPLWYLAICKSPGISVLCVTYDRNHVELGDEVILSGAFVQDDATHVVLDPCHASVKPRDEPDLVSPG